MASTEINPKKRSRGDEESVNVPEIQCCVCLDKELLPDDVILTGCGHVMCDSCNIKWCLSSMRDARPDITCPACRSKFTNWTMQTVKVLQISNDFRKDIHSVIGTPPEKRFTAITEFLEHYTTEVNKIVILKSFMRRGMLSETKFIIRIIAPSMEFTKKLLDDVSSLLPRLEGVDNERVLECVNRVKLYFPSHIVVM